MRVTGIMLLFALLLQGCGHKGPLFLPQAKPVAQEPTAQQPATQQPATQQPNQGQ